jgi:hypothetical protein
MSNAFSRMGLKCARKFAWAGAAGVFLAGAMFAAPVNDVTVTLPYAVTVGSVTLPAGQYVMSSFEMGGEDLFTIRGERTQPVTVRSQRVESDSDKTQLTIAKDGDKWVLDKLTVAGEGTAFEFAGAK